MALSAAQYLPCRRKARLHGECRITRRLEPEAVYSDQACFLQQVFARNRLKSTTRYHPFLMFNVSSFNDSEDWETHGCKQAAAAVRRPCSLMLHLLAKARNFD